MMKPRRMACDIPGTKTISAGEIDREADKEHVRPAISLKKTIEFKVQGSNLQYQ
jgi:hypothetical protein